MDRAEFTFFVLGENPSIGGRAAQALSDELVTAEGVLEVHRRKADEASMDLGQIVTAIATSGATIAIAQGVAAWLRARKGASITIEREAGTDSIKAVVAGIDAHAAIRIAEIVRNSREQ